MPGEFKTAPPGKFRVISYDQTPVPDDRFPLFRMSHPGRIDADKRTLKAAIALAKSLWTGWGPGKRFNIEVRDSKGALRYGCGYSSP